MVTIIVAWLICVGLAWLIGHNKGEPSTGVVLGLLFGPLGLVLLLFVPNNHDAKVRRVEQRLRIEEEARRRLNRSGSNG